MKRKIICLFLVLILLSMSFSSFAESNLERFEKLLSGKWEWEAISDATIYNDNAYSGFNYLLEFSFSKDNSRITRYVMVPNRTINNGMEIGKETNYKANIYLTEDSSGCIYITIIVPELSLLCAGKISFSDDGKTLMILSTTGGPVVYHKKN